MEQGYVKINPLKDNALGAMIPDVDGKVLEYIYKEAKNYSNGQANPYWDSNRTVIFINGMDNQPLDHARSALAVSFVHMCRVIGVYNRSDGWTQDFIQCVGDKMQFNSVLPGTKQLAVGGTSEADALAALSRNQAQVSLFRVLRANRHSEIVAHSQGNLILSNTLQAIRAVDGDGGIRGRVVHTFGSASQVWPPGIIRHNHAFTFDYVNFLTTLPDPSLSYSKVGWDLKSINPFTHNFLEYMNSDAEFLVNRFRTGGWGMTLNMDEKGLAQCLFGMGINMERVKRVFDRLKLRHSSDIDDVAVLYVGMVRQQPNMVKALKSHRALVGLLTQAMGSGVVSADERNAVAFLKTL